MRFMRRYGLFAILLILVVVTTFSLLACSTTDDSENENEIVKIRISEFQKAQVYYGDELDVDDSYILAITRGGAVHTIQITQSMISNYDSHKLGDQDITITYEGCSTTVRVTVLSTEVQGIAIHEKPSTVSVVQGGQLSLNGISLRVNYQTRSIIIDNVTNEMLRGYDKSLPVGTHTVYIVYAGFTAPLQIEVLDKQVIDVEIVSLPKDRQYFVGETLDPSGFSVKRTYDNGSEDVVSYNDNATVFSFEYDFSYERAYSLVKATVNGILVTFTCTVTEPVIVNFTVDVLPRTRAITLDGEVLTPSTDVLNIVEGAEIDWSTGSGTVYYDNGDKVTVALSDSSVYPFYNALGGDYLPKDHKFNEVGEQIVQLRYGNSDIYTPVYLTIKEKTPYRLLLNDKRPSANPESGLTFVEEQVYVEGSQFSTSFLVYNILYDNGSHEFNVNEVMEWGSIQESMLADDKTSTFNLSVSNLSSDGYQHVNFTINGVTNGYKLTVVSRKATYLKVGEPYRNVYLVADIVDLTGSYAYVEYNDNKVEKLSPIPESVITLKDSNGNPVSNMSMAGEYEMEVAIGGLKASFVINAVTEDQYVNNIALESMSLDDVHSYANFESIPFDSIKMIVTYQNGVKENVPLSSAEILVCDRYASGLQNVIFRYKGQIFTFKLNLEGRKVSSIEISKAPNKLVYVLGEDTVLDTTGLLVTKVFNDGDRGEQSYFDSYWSFEGYDLGVEGEQVVKVKYDLGDRVYYANFTIEVAKVKVASITFDEAQDGLETFTITNDNGDEETFRGVKVTYRDDLNLTFIYNTLDQSGVAVTEIRTLQITVIYENGLKVNRELKASYVSYDKNVNPNLSGNFKQTVQISYSGKTTTMNLYVVGRELTEVSVYTKPNVLTYAEGQSLNNEGGYLKRVYSDGSSDIIAMTNGLVTISGYVINPFEGVQGGSYVDQTITIGYGSETTSFSVRTYRKLHAEITLGNSIFSYGDNSLPIVNVRESITGFTTPATTIEYLVAGSWVSERPLLPGTYALRINTIENEYYEADVFESDDLKLIIKKKAIIITINALTKTYKDLDPAYTYEIEENELVEGDEIEILFSREEGEDVKYVVKNGQKEIAAYEIFATITKGFELYDLVYEQVGLTINPKVVGRNTAGNVIDVDFVTPNNYNSTTNTIKYTGLPIQSFGAKYTDVKGFTAPIDSKDILYYDANGVLLESLPVEVGVYVVKISDNYSFLGESSRTFTIVA